jgi:hypothetical protein
MSDGVFKYSVIVGKRAGISRHTSLWRLQQTLVLHLDLILSIISSLLLSNPSIPHAKLGRATRINVRMLRLTHPGTKTPWSELYSRRRKRAQYFNILYPLKAGSVLDYLDLHFLPYFLTFT